MVKKKFECLRPLTESLLPVKADDKVEYDEQWSYVGSKKNRVWLWIALCRRTKQVVALHFGQRTKEEFKKFYEKMPPAYAGCISHSDGFEVYKTISSYYHTASKKKNGRTTQVEAFNNLLRQRISRLVRKTCAFSKKEELHEAAIRTFIQEYNEKIYQSN